VSIFNYDQTDCFSGGCVENFDTFDEFESITRFCGRIDFKVRIGIRLFLHLENGGTTLCEILA
jgi:uncharacterized metal-binding protein